MTPAGESDAERQSRPLPLDGTPRLAYLEAMRGIAALPVMFGHILAASQLHGTTLAIVFTAINSPLTILINGRGSVIFFFTLSGYVLTLPALGSRTTPFIVRGILKRWPRLAFPVLVSILFTWFLWRNHLFFHTEHAAITHADWLKYFAFGSLDLAHLPNMGLRAAIRQGTYGTFVHGETWFNTTLWTMSLLIIWTRSTAAMFIILALLTGAMAYVDPLYVPFGIGLTLASLHASGRLSIAPATGMLLVVFAIYALGYRAGAVGYTWIQAFDPTSTAMTLVFTAASAALICGVTGWAGAVRHLSGRTARQLGSLSFPVYLLHVPVLLSLGSFVFVQVQPRFGDNLASGALLVATVAGTAVAALTLRAADRRWVSMLNAVVNRLLRVFYRTGTAQRGAVHMVRP
jgi:peptidoglycan/LPS O-acetylase OafA/YrhL